MFLGEVLFYRYVFLAMRQKAPIISGAITFEETVYRSVLEELQVREDIYKSSSQKDYVNPFNKPQTMLQ